MQKRAWQSAHVVDIMLAAATVVECKTIELIHARDADALEGFATVAPITNQTFIIGQLVVRMVKDA